jgi:hypothetical protein
VLLELARERRGRGQGQAEVVRELADGALALAAHLSEQGDMPASERRPLDEREQLGCGASAGPEPPHHPAQEPAELRHPFRFGYHPVSIIASERKEVKRSMCGGHHHGRRRFRGYPNREQWVDRLQAYREHLETELKNVQELIERLGEAPQQATETV